jgi:putative ABC transport system permease protein
VRGELNLPAGFQLTEVLRFSLQALRANRLRTALTALGLIIGNASVILVVTISLTARDYILDKIRGVGSNLVYAFYDAGNLSAAEVGADYVKLADVDAIRTQLAGRITAATAVINTNDRMVIAGREQDVKVIGTDEFYATVRNHVLVAGRFLDQSDVALRQKVALLTPRLAARLYNGQQNAIGQVIKVQGLQFTVIGTFRERTSTFGNSELSEETLLIPITVGRYFTPVERIDPLYVQARTPEDVPAVTAGVRTILESRHRPGARYNVENLASILEVAEQIASVLTVVLFLVALITLVISGIGIMNIMLVTVTERTKEIGLRKALGATKAAVLGQFLFEAVFISVAGGLLGILVGVAVPLSVSYFAPEFAVPLSITAVWIAFGVSFAVGIIFGILPANRAAGLQPTEALRYE